MPELPEMETYRQALTYWAVGQRITGIAAVRPKRLNRPVSVVEEMLLGHRIASIERRGKSLAITVDAPIPLNILYVHLMLGGRISLTEERDAAAVAVTMDTRRTVYFHLSLGRVDLITAGDLNTRWSKLGVEPLSPAYQPGLLYQAYHATARPIKSCLMDQHVVAGIGNVYSDEILYRAKLYPGTAARRLTNDDWHALESHVPRVLQEAVDNGGVGPPLRPDDRTTGAYRALLSVHYRQSQPCGNGGTVITERIGGRTSYWCPAVQIQR